MDTGTSPQNRDGGGANSCSIGTQTHQENADPFNPDTFGISASEGWVGITTRVEPPDAFTPDADAFRFYDDGTESGSNPKAAQDINIELDPTGDEPFHLRWRVQETGGTSGLTTDDYQLQVSKNLGAYVSVTGVSSNVQADTASLLVADGVTTNRGTNGITDGTGSFVAGEQEETDGEIEDRQLTASNFTEHVFACKLIAADLGLGVTLDFRLALNGGTPGMTNSIVPRISTPAAANLLFFYPPGQDAGERL